MHVSPLSLLPLSPPPSADHPLSSSLARATSSLIHHSRPPALFVDRRAAAEPTTAVASAPLPSLPGSPSLSLSLARVSLSPVLFLSVVCRLHHHRRPRRRSPSTGRPSSDVSFSLTSSLPLPLALSVSPSRTPHVAGAVPRCPHPGRRAGCRRRAPHRARLLPCQPPPPPQPLSPFSSLFFRRPLFLRPPLAPRRSCDTTPPPTHLPLSLPLSVSPEPYGSPPPEPPSAGATIRRSRQNRRSSSPSLHRHSSVLSRSVQLVRHRRPPLSTARAVRSTDKSTPISQLG